MRSVAAVDRARGWAGTGADALGAAAGRDARLPRRASDTDLVLAALRRGPVRGARAPTRHGLWTLVDGAGRLGIACAAPVLRHVYRETASSHLRGRAARALAATDPSFAAGFAVECLWDCEETTRELAARHAETGDARVARAAAPARRRPGRGGRGPDGRPGPPQLVGARPVLAPAPRRRRPPSPPRCRRPRGAGVPHVRPAPRRPRRCTSC